MNFFEYKFSCFAIAKSYPFRRFRMRLCADRNRLQRLSRLQIFERQRPSVDRQISVRRTVFGQGGGSGIGDDERADATDPIDVEMSVQQHVPRIGRQAVDIPLVPVRASRSEEHTSELQSPS